MTAEQQAFEGWVILELMGHRRLSGFLREQQLAGASFLRLDIEDEAGTPIATQFYTPAAVYCITPTTEELAREFARNSFDGPVHHWELKKLTPGRVYELDEDDDA